MNFKYLLIGGLVSVLGIAGGYHLVYRIYLSEGTKTVLKQLDYKSAIEGYALCQIHNHSIVSMPYDGCLDFFKYYVPQAFKKSAEGIFPIKFSNNADLIKAYNLVQKDLAESGKERLPSLTELTNGKIKT